MYKVLVANRGEIAIRVLRSASELGWATVAVYTEGDESHATFADEAVKLNTVAEYLDVGKIVEIAQRSECTHVHPGYGFLSESPLLARALPPSIKFIGPTTDTLQIASDKLLSRELAQSLNVSVTPGRRVKTDEEVRSFAKRHQYPIMVKALDGGGGRGIRLVKSEDEVQESLKRCLGESPSKQIFVEKALTGAGWKHIEVQIVGDGTGAVNHLWERECSVQRRFQKIMELAPSTASPSIVEELVAASTKMAQHLNYHGLGTFEFLVNSQNRQWVFLEINPRIQVEHTITEEVNGIDLVRAQLQLFTGSTTLASLSLAKPVPRPTSTAIQLRLTAEDPSKSFQLHAGPIRAKDIQWPTGLGVRVDTWLTTGPSSPEPLLEWTVGTEFDSLLAKIIVRGSDLREATQRALRALKEVKLGAETKTNISALAGVLDSPDWLGGRIDTLWLERNTQDVLSRGTSALKAHANPLPLRKQPDSLNKIASSSTVTLQPGALFHLTLSPKGDTSAQNAVKHSLTLSSISQNGFPDMLSGTLQTSFSPAALNFSLSQSSSAAVSSSSFELGDPNNPAHIVTPFTGKIVELHPALLAARENGAEGKTDVVVKAGESVAVISVMKMESVIRATSDGVVERVGRGIRIGEVVGEGMLICIIGKVGISSRL